MNKDATERLRADNIEILYEISKYKKNWDGEGALPFPMKLIRDIFCVLKRLDHQPTAVGPLGEGNIQLQFYRPKSGYFLEIEFTACGLIKCHNHFEGKKDTHRFELDDIPVLVAEWMKQREAYCEKRKHDGSAEKG